MGSPAEGLLGINMIFQAWLCKLQCSLWESCYGNQAHYDEKDKHEGRILKCTPTFVTKTYFALFWHPTEMQDKIQLQLRCDCLEQEEWDKLETLFKGEVLLSLKKKFHMGQKSIGQQQLHVDLQNIVT